MSCFCDIRHIVYMDVSSSERSFGRQVSLNVWGRGGGG